MDHINGSISANRGTTRQAVMGRVYSHLRNSLNLLRENIRALASIGLARKLHTSGTSAQPAPADLLESIIVPEERTMWTKPDFTEMRFGFEITMYIGNR